MAPGVLGNLGEVTFNFRRWGVLEIIFEELESKLIVCGIKGALPKSKT